MTSIEREMRIYRPAIQLDHIVSRKVRKGLLLYGGVILSLLGAICFAVVFLHYIQTRDFSFLPLITSVRPVWGSFLVLLSLYLALLSITFYYNTFYYRGVKRVTKEELNDHGGLSIEAARVMYHNPYDLTQGFLASSYGEETMTRAGIPVALVPEFLGGERERLLVTAVSLPLYGFFSLHDLGIFLYRNDASLRDFLFTHGITEELFLGASSWVSRVRLVHKYKKRWWSRDNLSKREGIGNDFAYGVAFELEQFMRNLANTSALQVNVSDIAYVDHVIESLELILTRSKTANAILIGEPGAGEMDILIEFGRRMREGRALSSVTGKQLVVFDTESFVATYSSKDTFEPMFLSLMSGAEHAGNIILVIENLPAFIRSVVALGSDVGELLDHFLASPSLQIIATADPRAFHAELELHQSLLRGFEQISVVVPDLTSTIAVLEEATWQYEKRYGYFFTYPAVQRIAQCADQYLVDGVMPDKALNLLSMIASDAAHERLRVVTPVFVDKRVSATIGIPVGPIEDNERSMLLHLEDELHKRVVGQEAALSAIAGAMRRARSGIQSTRRPIGSFLFLGSTGVGKTETAKALAALFFGSEEKMVRFDMSEFSGPEGVDRLLGTALRGGMLASALHEQPYCVLLLDELEKASHEVHDLFLQVLDEGIFTDARGMRVNCRNTIIIATSNAGSGKIWTLTQAGKSPQDARDEIIDTIIDERVFRPEFINRFDGTIIFASLREDEQRAIARLMLTDLEKRIRNRGYSLVVNDVLLDVLMKEGFNPQFGARPMRRAIQDVIEERVARKIIEGNLTPGARIEFSRNDFT